MHTLCPLSQPSQPPVSGYVWSTQYHPVLKPHCSSLINYSPLHSLSDCFSTPFLRQSINQTNIFVVLTITFFTFSSLQWKYYSIFPIFRPCPNLKCSITHLTQPATHPVTPVLIISPIISPRNAPTASFAY